MGVTFHDRDVIFFANLSYFSLWLIICKLHTEIKNNMKTKVRFCQTVAIKKYPLRPKFLSKKQVLIFKNNLKNG